MHFQLPVSKEILAAVSELDRFQGRWSAQQSVSAESLRRILETTRVQSVAASCRIAGIHVSDAQVAELLTGKAVALDDAQEILGYARALRHRLSGPGPCINGDLLQQIHAEMLGAEDEAARSTWREQSLHREAFDAGGHATGQVFATLPPRFVQRKTEELTTWLELELRSRDQHPVLVIGGFLLCFLSISPFERANGRLTRLLANLLLDHAGYSAISFASLEMQMEDMRGGYWAGVSRSQTHLWTDEVNLLPWLEFFLELLGRHREQVEVNLARERQIRDYPPLQRAILEAVREHGSVDAALLREATGANRNTLKDNLRRLVGRGVLEKIGERRATRYRMPTEGRVESGPTALEH